MKLVELSQLTEATIFDENQLKRTQWESPRKVRSWLKSQEFKHLGGGAYAAAYGKKGHKRIVKISMKQDNCWLKFAKWTLTQTNNKYLPNISWVREYSGTRKGKQEIFFITLMERLDPYSTKIIKQIDDPVVLAAILLEGDLYAPERKVLRNALNINFHFDTDKELKELLLDNHNHKFLKTIQTVKKVGGKCEQDLHTGNFMYRPKTNTIVITDPVAEQPT